MNGGEGWSRTWDVSSTDGGQIAMITSLFDSEGSGGNGNKLGVLNNAASSTSLTRSLSVDLGGSEQLNYSMYIERLSGMGATTIALGGLDFGINQDGRFFLGREVGPSILLNQIYQLKMKVIINDNGVDEVFLSIIPKGTNASETVTINSSAEIETAIQNLTLNFSSISSFVPLVHYIDDIRLGCDDNYEEQSIVSIDSDSQFLSKSRSNSESKNTSISTWPNPSKGLSTSIKIEGDQLFYNYKLVDVSGHLINQGAFFNGVNKVANVQDLKGVFFLLVETNSEVITTKLVMEY